MTLINAGARGTCSNKRQVAKEFRKAKACSKRMDLYGTGHT